MKYRKNIEFSKRTHQSNIFMHSPFNIDMIVFNDCFCIIKMLCIIHMIKICTVQNHLGNDWRKVASLHSLAAAPISSD